MNIEELTIKKVHEGLCAKKFSSHELIEAFFDEVETHDKDIGAFLSLHKESAYIVAKEVDAIFRERGTLHPLSGVPLGIKDNIVIEGEITTAASKILGSYRAVYDATVIKKLKEHKAIFLGKNNLDEFAMGSSTENSAYKITRNPHDKERVPGGSSGGGAAAVARGFAVAALGSDTGGSIRQPASFCGVVGLKPTYGAVSRSGLIAMASSLDQIGPITKTVDDAALLFDAIKGIDPLDATSTEGKYTSKSESFTIGLPREYFIDGLDKEVAKKIEEVIEKFKSLKINIKPVSLPHTRYALSVYYIIMPAEVSSNLARYDGIRYGTRVDGIKESISLSDLYVKNRSEGFGDEVTRRIILGTYVLSSGYYDAYYSKAQKVRALITQDFQNVFREVDVILAPVAPTPPFKIGEKTKDPLSMYLSDIFTIPANLAGLPALALPHTPWKPNSCGKIGLPVGFQLIGKRWHEEDLFALGRLYEEN